MAIYQRFSYATMTSRWILIQVPPAITGWIQSSFLSQEKGLDQSDIHARVFTIAERDWRDYICYLDDELRAIEEKASFVDVAICSDHDYDIAFADSQKLQRLRRMILKSKEILNGSLDVGHGCKAHWQDLFSRKMSDPGHNLTVVAAFVARLKMNKRSIEAIQEHAEGIAALLSHILSYRNQDAMIRSNEALNQNGAAMREIAQAAKAENELIAILTRKAQKDSHTIKILSIVALIYLPASLTAGIFSSNLIQTRTTNDGIHLVLSNRFWWYPVITSALMLLTFTPIWALLPRDKPNNNAAAD